MDICNILKYDRSLYPGKAVFFYKTDDCDFVPLEADVNRIRGQKAGFTEAFSANFEPKNLEPQDLTHSNLLIIEECYVPPNIEHLFCRFSLRVQANSLHPSGCSSPEVFALLKEFAEKFKECGGYKELAMRYCKNILLGTWLWRNQNTGKTEIEIKTSAGNSYIIKNTRLIAWESSWPSEEKEVLEKFGEEMHQALTDPSVFWSADITAKIETVFCQEVYPSQILSDTSKRTEAAKATEASKQFAKVKCVDGRSAVSFNSVKIGAALQSIDDWWGDDVSKRLRVHEFGADKELGIARRSAEVEINFYSLLINVDTFKSSLTKNAKKGAEAITGNMYYFVAVLIKGGMFQKKAKKSKKAKTEKKEEV